MQNQLTIKCTDLLVKVLGYRDSSQAKWFTEMKTDSDMVIKIASCDTQPQYCFTLRGLNYAIQKNNRIPKDMDKLLEICEQYNIHMPCQKKSKKVDGYIYIIHCDNLPFIKCGLTTNLKIRIASYQTSHWDVIVKRAYIVPQKYELKNIEKQVFEYLVGQGCQQKSEKFKPNDINQLDEILNNLDKFIVQLMEADQ